MTTHPLNQRGCDPFRIAHGFMRPYGEMQVSPMDPMEGAQIGPKRRAGPCHRYGRALHVGPLRHHCAPTRACRGGRWHGTGAPPDSATPHRCGGLALGHPAP
jgi:hypothetical protein